MVCRLIGAKQFSEPMMNYCLLDPEEQISVNPNQDSYTIIQ